MTSHFTGVVAGTRDFGGLAATGSDVAPWLIIAGIIVLLGVIALIIAGVVRSRRAGRQVEDAAEAVADAGGTLPTPDPNAPASAETVIEEASELGGAAAAAEGASGHPDSPVGATLPAESDPAEITPSPEFAPNLGPLGQDLNAPADTSWPADGESYPREPTVPGESSPEAEPKETPPFDAPEQNDDPSK